MLFLCITVFEIVTKNLGPDCLSQVQYLFLTFTLTLNKIIKLNFGIL